MQRTRPGGESKGGDGPRQRPRGSGGELELSEEEKRALADEGLDPEDLGASSGTDPGTPRPATTIATPRATTSRRW